MSEYKVKIFPAAQNDLLDIMEAASSLPPETTVLYFSSITEKLGTLATSPESYPLARDTLLRLRGYRTLPVENYIAFFTVNGVNVELHRVLCARRQYARLL